MSACQGGAEYVSELVVGSDPIAWISAWGLSQPVHLSFPPFAAFSNHSLQLLPLLRRHCAGATLLSVNGSSKGIGICCCSSNPFPQLKEHSRQDAGGRTEGKVQNNISKAQLEGAASLVLLETSQTVHTLNEKAAAANDLSSAVSCIHTEDVLQEMANFKASALRWAPRPRTTVDRLSMKFNTSHAFNKLQTDIYQGTRKTSTGCRGVRICLGCCWFACTSSSRVHTM